MADHSPRRFRDGGVSLRCRLHRDGGTAAGLVELHLPFGQREQGVISAHTDIVARVELRAPLAYQDVAWNDRFATEFLDAEALADGIATVA